MIDPSAFPEPPMSSRTSRIHRLQRIFARLEEGATYGAIAEEEGISAQRVCQIIAAATDAGDGRIGPVHRQMQLARLMPALRLARKKLAAGDASAIRPMLAVLDRLDRYAGEPTFFSRANIDPEALGPKAAERLKGLDGLGAIDEWEARIERQDPPRGSGPDEEIDAISARENAEKFVSPTFFRKALK